MDAGQTINQSKRVVKTLIIDDSLTYRSQLRSALESVSGVTVLDALSNGKLGLDRLKQLQVDLITLDLEMPIMDGLTFLRELKTTGFTGKVIVLSSYSKSGAEITMEALNLGAVDFIQKPTYTPGGKAPHEMLRELLEPKVSALFPLTHISEQQPLKLPSPSTRTHSFHGEIVVIGSSTGGPTALEILLPSIPVSLPCPIVIAQHMPPLFTKTLAERLTRLTGRPVHEATDGQEVKRGEIYIAPGDYHLTLEKNRSSLICRLDQGPKIHSVRPAVDRLFKSAADVFGANTLAVVLTGMGYDGLDGARYIKEKKGYVLIQDENSCVVFGMPGAIYNANLHDSVLSLNELPQKIFSLTCGASIIKQNERKI